MGACEIFVNPIKCESHTYRKQLDFFNQAVFKCTLRRGWTTKIPVVFAGEGIAQIQKKFTF